MDPLDQARYYAQRASDVNEPLVDGIIEVFDLDPGLRTRLTLRDALTRAYRHGRRDGAAEVVAQLCEADLAVECEMNIEIATGPLGGFG
jgi:hypothetical protein